MNTYGGMQAYLHGLTSEPYGDEQSASRVKTTGTRWVGGWVGPTEQVTSSDKDRAPIRSGHSLLTVLSYSGQESHQYPPEMRLGGSRNQCGGRNRTRTSRPLHRSLVTVLTKLSGPKGPPVPYEEEAGRVCPKTIHDAVEKIKIILAIVGNRTWIPWPFIP
jgi:hypothetical protein